MSRVSNQDQLARHADADGLRLKTGGDAIALSWRDRVTARLEIGRAHV